MDDLQHETASLDLRFAPDDFRLNDFIVRLLSFDRRECGPNASFSYVVVTGPRGDAALSSEQRTPRMRVKKLEREVTANGHWLFLPFCVFTDTARLLVNVYNTLWRPVLGSARRLRLAAEQPASNWLSQRDVINLCTLADWDVFKTFGAILLPVPLGSLSTFVNRWLAPFLGSLCLSIFFVARRSGMPRRESSVVSVVIPARNEAGSIAQTIERVPPLGRETELIFIEGHSKDDTREVISALPDTFAHGRIIKLRQSGKGKGNAVIEGFRAASGGILMILDADLTMPPEDLPKFVEALSSGKGDFANGVRLVYPMDERAMKFANLCANKMFSLVFSWLLGQPLKDTLCGTKVLWREDYERIDSGRAYFGDFDPFGDFDLLFGADKQSLKIVDIPIRYKERFYGDTNIQRWKHGVILIRMMLFAARRLKFV